MAHGHGGRREGAGRKPGTPNSRETAKIIKDLMEPARPRSNISCRSCRTRTRQSSGAIGRAAEAAPYCHPRLSAVDQTITFKGDHVAQALCG